MRYLSVCSGIEAATQAWHPLGWTPVAFSEIEPFPSAVLAYHYPDVPNWGDMTKFEEWPDATIDVLCGGTPCQSFSVAGLREGLADPRGNLMLTFGAIAGRYRPKWLVWENVPGVLSSNGGRDFGTFLGMLGQLGYGVAYRVLDAQHVRTRRFPFAVPQRRRRVWVVGYLGDWRRAAAVLFDRESLSGHPPPRRETGTAVAALTANGVGTCGADDNQGQAGHLIAANSGDVGYCLTASAQASSDAETETLLAVPVAFDCKGTKVQFSDDGSHPTLRSMGHSNSHQNGGGHAAVALPSEGNTDADAYEADASSVLSTLRDEVGAEAYAQWGLAILAAFRSAEVLQSWLHGKGLREQIEEARSRLDDGTLPRPEDMPAGALRLVWESGPDGRSPQGRGLAKQLSGKSGEALSVLSLEAPQDKARMHRMRQAREGAGLLRQALPTLQEVGRSDVGETEPAHSPWAVRRLTPVEAERLMGFPDDFTNIPWRGKPTATDGPRYKALGNSWAVNCAEWIGERIQMVEDMA